MSRPYLTILLGFAAAAWLSLGPAYAQGHGAKHIPSARGHPAAGTHSSPPAKAPKSSTPTKPTTVAARIDAHPELIARLKPLLPSNMTLDQAAQGFKNQGQFIAALHVSHNLGIPFDKLKGEMTGTDRDSLGQAIHDLMPAANAKAEAKKAEAETKEDLKAASKKPDHDTDRDDH